MTTGSRKKSGESQPLAILFARIGYVENEDIIIRELREFGITTVIVRRADELLNWLNFEATRQIMTIMVDLLSILDEARNIDDYRVFLETYSRTASRHNIPLVVLLPRQEQEPKVFIGYGHLVTAYLRQPISSVDLRHLFDKMMRRI